ncbi:MAG TPA: response regulator [Candidatus Limnocylindrales bacterium]|nr:response regulator [Candidatus Limnocylindrales bacterium]
MRFSLWGSPDDPGQSAGDAAVRVLLVDDDREEHMLLRSKLRGAGSMDCELDWVGDPAQALPAMRANAYDAYLVDYRLGADSGVELVRAAREAGCVGPIVMLTGHGSDTVDRAALQAGATDFVEKGRNAPTVLERTLGYAISQARVADALRRSLRQVSALEALGRELSENGPTPDVLEQVMRLLADEFGHERASLYLVEDGILRLAGAVGYQDPAHAIDPRSGRLGAIIQSGRPGTLPNLTTDPSARSGADPLEYCVPLIAEGQCLGILNVAISGDSLATEESARGVRVIADRLGVALALNRAIGGRSFVNANVVRAAAPSPGGEPASP